MTSPTPQSQGGDELGIDAFRSRAALSKTSFTGMDVSRYVGHDYTGNDDPFSASPVKPNVSRCGCRSDVAEHCLLSNRVVGVVRSRTRE